MQYFLACQWTTAVCINCRSIWKQALLSRCACWTNLINCTALVYRPVRDLLWWRKSWLKMDGDNFLTRQFYLESQKIFCSTSCCTFNRLKKQDGCLVVKWIWRCMLHPEVEADQLSSIRSIICIWKTDRVNFKLMSTSTKKSVADRTTSVYDLLNQKTNSTR